MLRDDALARAKDLETRVLALRPPNALNDMYAQLRSALLKASDEKAIATAPQEVFRLLKQKKDGTAVYINGATEDDPFVRTSDNAGFNFGVTIAVDPRGHLALVAYRFHVKYVSGCVPSYARIDLNRTAKPDSLFEPQAHVHPGAKDLRLPTPLMHPLELLDYMIYGGPADVPCVSVSGGMHE